MIGQRVVDEALSRDYEVTLIARHLPPSGHPRERLALVEGDVLDDSLGLHVAGLDAVVSAVGSARAESPDPSLYLRAAQSLVGVLRGLGEAAPGLVVVGGVGSLQDDAGRLLLERVPEERRAEHAGQKAALDYLRTVGDIRWTYASPPARIEPGERTGVYRTGTDTLLVGADGESAISMEDYAVAVLDEVALPRHSGKRFTVAN